MQGDAPLWGRVEFAEGVGDGGQAGLVGGVCQCEMSALRPEVPGNGGAEAG